MPDPVDFIALNTASASSIPSAGRVHLRYDTELPGLVIRTPEGDLIPVTSGGISDTLWLTAPPVDEIEAYTITGIIGGVAMEQLLVFAAGLLTNSQDAGYPVFTDDAYTGSISDPPRYYLAHQDGQWIIGTQAPDAVLWVESGYGAASPQLVEVWNAANEVDTVTVTATPIPGTPATQLGQSLIVSTTNNGRTHLDVFCCVSLEPILWNPPGHIFRDRSSNVLHRQFVENDIPMLEIAYPL